MTNDGMLGLHACMNTQKNINFETAMKRFLVPVLLAAIEMTVLNLFKVLFSLH